MWHYRGLSLVAHAGKVLLKIAVNRLANFFEEAGIISKEQSSFRPQCSTTDMMFRAQTAGTGMAQQHFTRDLLYRPGKSIRLCRSCGAHGKYLPVLESHLG